jgi:hypothetical protein
MESDHYHKLLEAVSRNELEDFIMGRKDYSVTEPLVEYPTMTGAVFMAFDRASANQPEIEAKFNQALKNLMITAEGAWW